ncbi:hypothetical protein FJV41_44340 [Myxococcus llanfairpwllgwyngyllgogerychwyrndrobwllllantysiliogogogochensis]|uniref:Uncharacterized protein n=1 Tax=Myxococcus llanfairpwllgwyngyllgogerychwyrndrobwllllantysiliogogogochensis TaxID=2590453 RepID=A0A540WKE4_9BACT|nr:hypothetical protein [Myxococcus llanfairpwllgwyngyllgogerychwyrndrobwllllantysiliogogogochensis]TQF09485.1 hypothetical protein FJV41_44340 [Myxococcus llanfairpwllgwyngyllgogerychwyrndrobwllllantysiliogogogochensis]
MSQRSARSWLWLAGVAVLALPGLAPAQHPLYTIPWEDKSQVLEYRSCGCADSCWVAELRAKKGRKLLARLRCDCEKLWVIPSGNSKEAEYRATCDGFDTERKLDLIAEELKKVLKAHKPAP